MGTDKVRWGVLSTARIGRIAVIPAIQASRNGELGAVASRDLARARAFAEAAGFARCFGSYEALLEDPDIDAIYIPLPNSGHRPWTVRAIEQGKHVLCEKPLGLTEAECLAMGEAAERKGVRLMEAFMYRFHPRTERAIGLAHDGVIGDLRMIRTAFTFRLDDANNIRFQPELGGGALMDVGCYCVNISRAVMGTEPVEVQAYARWTDGAVDEQLAGTMLFEDGAIAQFDCAFTIERRERYEIAGTDGELHVPAAFVPGTGDVVIDERHGRDEPVLHSITGVDQYRIMVERFADAVLNGGTHICTATDAGRNMRVIEALLASAHRGGDRVRF